MFELVFLVRAVQFSMSETNVDNLNMNGSNTFIGRFKFKTIIRSFSYSKSRRR